MPDDQKKAVRWYIDCGDDDFLFEGNSLVHIAMRKKEIVHEFGKVHTTGHTGANHCLLFWNLCHKHFISSKIKKMKHSNLTL